MIGKLQVLGYNSEMQIDFSALCKELRSKGKYSQQEMSDLLEVNLRTYQRWEEGVTEPSAQAVVRLLSLKSHFETKKA